jgi:hypothetical protein
MSVNETVVGRIFGPAYDWGAQTTTTMLRTKSGEEIPLIIRGRDLLGRCKRNRDLRIGGERNTDDNWGLCARTAIVVATIR